MNRFRFTLALVLIVPASIVLAGQAAFGTDKLLVRDHVTHPCRFVRFFACEQDLSPELPDAPMPDAVASGAEPFLVVGLIAGG